MPEAVANLNLRSVESLWMVAEDSFLEQRIRANEDFWHGVSDEELMIQLCLERSIWHDYRTTALGQERNSLG